MLYYEEFYPTPASLIDQMLRDINFSLVQTVLEPSAGKGNIAEAISQKIDAAQWRTKENGKTAIDCIEINPDLRSILVGKGFKVVHDDFLTYRTKKQYDLIVMNPPFSNGDMHLLHALSIVRDGGTVVCLLNAETVRNSYSKSRKLLTQLLNDYGAHIQYVSNGFSTAERKTDVEVALVRVTKPEKERESFIFSDLQQKSYTDIDTECRELVGGDFISQIVKQYEMEVEAGIRLINEYRAMLPKILYSFEDDCGFPTIEMKLRDKGQYSSDKLSLNAYVELVRLKYWDALFHNKTFTGMLTSNLQNDLYNKVQTLKDYDFSVYNIRSIQCDIMTLVGRGVEDTILHLFDELSSQHSWCPECSKNIHYYNGWATNKAYYINKKVILPIHGAFSQYGWSSEAFETYHVYEVMRDIEKTLDYLDNGETVADDDLYERLKICSKNGTTKNISLKYFSITLYKKGTCHIVFHDQRLVDRLNIYGSQRKGWLPPSYGKKQYRDMTPEEQAVVSEFQGEESYNKVMQNPTKYIIEASRVLALGTGGEYK